jgi:hypothetical protein
MTKLEREYRTWRQTPQSEAVMNCYRRLAKEAAALGGTFEMQRLALGGVRWELTTTGDPDLGAPEYKVYDQFLAQIHRDLIREMPELQPHVKPPVRRPGGRNARPSGATR